MPDDRMVIAANLDGPIFPSAAGTTREVSVGCRRLLGGPPDGWLLT
jgi:hypothetical protein